MTDAIDVIVLGAGVAGLAAARRLSLSGCRVQVVDKGRGVGGRLATRRVGDAVIDHGAQFFTTRGAAFGDVVDAAQRDGAVREWCRGFGQIDGYPRYRGAAGMTGFAKWMARGLPIELDIEAHRVETWDGRARLVLEDGTTVASAPQMVITAPIPQTLALLDRGEVGLPGPLDDQLRAIDYFATLALLAVVDGIPAVAEPGGMQLTDGPFTFIADNHRKGISPVRALTFHANHDYSRRRYDDGIDEVRHELIELAAPWISPSTLVEAELKRWRFAGPVTPLPFRTASIESAGARIALAGDAYGGPKVEGAFNSGEAAAAALLDAPS